MAIAPDQLPVITDGWSKRAACHGLTALFFAARGEYASTNPMADEVCAGCAVFGPCLRWSLLHADTLHGRAAMVGPIDRRRYRRRWNVTPPPQPTIEGTLNPILAALRIRRDRLRLGPAAKRFTMPCVCCGTDFGSDKATALYCSTTCRSAAQRDRDETRLTVHIP